MERLKPISWRVEPTPRGWRRNRQSLATCRRRLDLRWRAPLIALCGFCARRVLVDRLTSYYPTYWARGASMGWVSIELRAPWQIRITRPFNGRRVGERLALITRANS